MSHHSGDDALLVASSDSFWEPGNYKKTTKRIEDGHRLCNDLMTLLTERGDIERCYAKSLHNWAKKWNDQIEKGPEYGTTEAAWKAVLVEADRRCEVQTRIKERLHQEVLANIKHWQKEYFHKSMMQIKEKKEMDDSFKKAQKPWAKLLAKVNKAKSDYHVACKNERSAVNQNRNAGADTSLSPDQVRKLQEKESKSKDEVQRTKDKYQLALMEIREYNPKYMEDMTVVFDKCQEFEEKRLVFFKEMLFGIHACLNISADEEIPQIYEEYKHTINNADAAKDLKWWSNNHGVAMGMNWPTFEEYAPDMHKISSKEKKNKNQVSGDGGVVTLTTINHSNDSKNKSETDSSNRQSTVSSNGKPENYPFDEDRDEWDEFGNELVDSGEPGVPVRALYDYDGAEGDELSFKIGDVFEKLEDEDEQGWCKGRREGVVGLYPANYVEII